MKSFNTLTQTLIVLLLTIPCALVAQDMPKLAKMENLDLTSANGKMTITWKTNLEKDGDFFLVEKLDENWDYVTVGKVAIENNASSLSTYSIEDANPTEGENYYRITVITNSGDKYLTDLLIADHFKPKNNEFKFLFNDKYATYALNKTLDTTPTEIGYFGDNKYASNTLKVRRIKSAVSTQSGQDISAGSMNTMVASLELE